MGTRLQWTRVEFYHPDLNCQRHLHLDFDCHVNVISILIVEVIVLIVIKDGALIIKAFYDANIHGPEQSLQNMVTLWLM